MNRFEFKLWGSWDIIDLLKRLPLKQNIVKQLNFYQISILHFLSAINIMTIALQNISFDNRLSKVSDMSVPLCSNQKIKREKLVDGDVFTNFTFNDIISIFSQSFKWGT